MQSPLHLHLAVQQAERTQTMHISGLWIYLCDRIVATCIHCVYVASQEPLQAPLMQMECLDDAA